MDSSELRIDADRLKSLIRQVVAETIAQLGDNNARRDAERVPPVSGPESGLLQPVDADCITPQDFRVLFLGELFDD